MLQGRNLICPTDFSVEEMEQVFRLCDDIVDHPHLYAKACAGKILASLFSEPSTRTRLSFEAAMLRLGGEVIGFSDPLSSSSSKGEVMSDTIRMINGYADIAVIRHPVEGAPMAASLYSGIPVINAGDGGHLHPTQTLTDLYTIRKVKGHFENLTVGLCGDLKFGRTVHSLIRAMSRYKNVQFVLISPKELRVPSYVWEELQAQGAANFREVESLDDCIDALDILYMTRIQQERFASREAYERLKDCYVLDARRMAMARADMMVLHPLPRVHEIAQEVDTDPRACYLVQAQYGMYVRMALIISLLGMLGRNPVCGSNLHEVGYKRLPQSNAPAHTHCKNPRCILRGEPHLPKLVKMAHDGLRCVYCDSKYVPDKEDEA